MNKRLRNRVLLIAAILSCVYLSSYLVLSRLGMARARQYDMDGFYYIDPPAAYSRSWAMTTIALCLLYAPLNAIDEALGTGMPAINNAMYLS